MSAQFKDIRLNDRLGMTVDLGWRMLPVSGDPGIIPEKRALYQLARRAEVPLLETRFSDVPPVLAALVANYGVRLRLAVRTLNANNVHDIDALAGLFEWLLDARTTNPFDDMRRYLLEHPPPSVDGATARPPRKNERAGGDAQAWFCSLFAVFSAVALYKATVAQSQEASAVSAGASVLLFLIAVACLFFPRDMIWGDDYMAVRDITFSEHSLWHVMTRSLRDKHRENSIVVWAFIYRFVLLIQWVLSYGAMVIVWFLADGQFFSNALNLHDTLVAFLVCDAVFVVPFQLLLVFLTFKNVVKKVTAEDRGNGHVHFAASSGTVMHQYDQL